MHRVGVIKLCTCAKELFQYICFIQLRVLCPHVVFIYGVSFGLLYNIVRSAKRLCKSELGCLGHRTKVIALCLLYNIYHMVGQPMNKYVNHFVAACNTRASAALGELALVISRYIIDQFSRSILLVSVRLWNLLPSGAFRGNAFSSFKSAMNSCLLKT